MRFRRLFITSTICGVTIAFAMLAVLTVRGNRKPGTLTDESANALNRIRLPAGVTLPEPPEDPCHRLHRTICSLRGTTRDPTGSVRPDVEGEKMALGIYQEIIRANPNWTSEQVDEELVRRIYNPRNRSRVESAFRFAQHSIERFIESRPEQVFTATEKRELIARIHQIDLQLPPPTSVYADETYLFTKNDVFYERLIDGKMRLRVGGAYFFSSRSWFNMLFTLGHEIAHSIDPCEVRAARLSFPAYDRLSACFLEVGLIATPKERLECGSSDQLSEAFADWMAARVVADALDSYSTEFDRDALFRAAVNSVRDLCEPEDTSLEMDTEFHPPPTIRIGRIFGDNPHVRRMLGCPVETAQRRYCSFESELADSPEKPHL